MNFDDSYSVVYGVETFHIGAGIPQNPNFKSTALTVLLLLIWSSKFIELNACGRPQFTNTLSLLVLKSL